MPSGGVRLRSSSDDEAWDRLVTQHPAGTAFHLSRFLRTAGRLLGLTPRLTLVEVDGKPVGLMPMLVREVGLVAVVNHALPMPYVGPLLAPDFPADCLIPAVRRYLRPRMVAHVGMRSLAPFPFAGLRGWTQQDAWIAAVVPTAHRDDDELVALLTRSQRLKLNQALRRGLVAGPATRDEISRLAQWANTTLRRQGKAPRWPAGAHLELYDALAGEGICVATAVRQDDELLAVSVDMILGELMVGWEMGLSDEGRAAGASLVLHTANMRRARDLGATCFDLLGTPTPGIRRYKQSLGAEFRLRGSARWEPGWLPSRRRLRRLSGMLPGRAARATRPSQR